jgi:hypothetical protein
MVSATLTCSAMPSVMTKPGITPSSFTVCSARKNAIQGAEPEAVSRPDMRLARHRRGGTKGLRNCPGCSGAQHAPSAGNVACKRSNPIVPCSHITVSPEDLAVKGEKEGVALACQGLCTGGRIGRQYRGPAGAGRWSASARPTMRGACHFARAARASIAARPLTREALGEADRPIGRHCAVRPTATHFGGRDCACGGAG